MDREVPENNREDTDASIKTTEDLILYINTLTQTCDLPLIHPVVTPRFAISCTPELLGGLGELAEQYDVRIQTHISENLDDIARMGELFPDNTSYADVYDSFKLLGPKTILAHAVHLWDDEVKLIAEKGAGISHCPTSNFNLTSGVAPVGKYLDAGIKVRTFCLCNQSLHQNHTRFLLGWLGNRCLWRVRPFDPQCHPACKYRLQGDCLAI